MFAKRKLANFNSTMNPSFFTKPILAVALAFAGLSTALAHHNPASHYLLDKTITVTGVVTKFRLINPHARIYFDVTSDDEKTEAWLAEGNAAAILKRRGWTNDSLKAGARISISGSPARDGGNKLDWRWIVLEDGTELRGGNTVAAERERQIDELDSRRKRRK